jgi:hypothetical protein
VEAKILLGNRYMRTALRLILLWVGYPATWWGFICLNLAALTAHLWTILLGYAEGGWFGAVFALCTPILAEARFLWIEHLSPSGVDPLYAATIIAIPVGWGLAAFGAFLITAAESLVTVSASEAVASAESGCRVLNETERRWDMMASDD